MHDRAERDSGYPPTGAPLGGWRETVCCLDDDDGNVVATVVSPMDDDGSARIVLCATAAAEACADRHRRAVERAVAAGATAAVADANERLLANVHELISGRLLPHLDRFPRVVLDLRHPPLRALPIETAHRQAEPALFEVTQLVRRAGGHPSPCGRYRPRRFQLDLRTAEVSNLDLIALEQSLIHWVSHLAVAAGATSADSRVEPLVHVAGHDPTIPSGVASPDDSAHVILSGCGSVPHSLPPGVSSAVGSLWPIEDHANSTIMAAYHARLAVGISPIESLRQAQLLHRYLPPSGWAAYVHVGQPI